MAEKMVAHSDGKMAVRMADSTADLKVAWMAASKAALMVVNWVLQRDLSLAEVLAALKET